MSDVRHYRSEDGLGYFTFRFIWNGDFIEIYCLKHPPLNGRDSNPHKTHLFNSGKICFVAGQEPCDGERAGELAKQWAEYLLTYIATGIAQA